MQIPTSPGSPTQQRHGAPIVAVASSAGDLGAVFELLAALPAISSQAFMIVQHLDPARRGLSLSEALAKRTSIPVVVAQDGSVPKPGHIYVAGANTTVTIVGERLCVSLGAGGPQGPGDALLSSVAADRGVCAVGVVLSGAGADGAIGVQAIRAVGGTTFAQFPGSARFPSMPLSAIDTGCVDSVLRPNEIARELARLNLINARYRTDEVATSAQLAVESTIAHLSEERSKVARHLADVTL